MKNKLKLIMVIDALITISLLFFNFFYLSKIISYSSTLYFVFASLFFLPIMLVRYFENRRVKEMEENFPVFLRDFVEATRGGMTIPRAFQSISKNDYGALNPYIKKMSAQLDWSITVEKVLNNFSKDTKSRLISRIISTVIETHKFGGNLANTFEALSNTSFEIEKLREERKLYIHSQMITGYIIFFVFLAVLIGLQKFLVPSMMNSQFSATGAPTNALSPEAMRGEYTNIFRNLILMQGLFAGLSIGRMAEGAMTAGIKHSLIMMLAGGVVFTVFTL